MIKTWVPVLHEQIRCPKCPNQCQIISHVVGKNKRVSYRQDKCRKCGVPRVQPIARRTNSATGAPVFSDSACNFFNCSSFKNNAVRLMAIPYYIGIYMSIGRSSMDAVDCGAVPI